MLSNTSRLLTYACAFLYGILGALLFLFPETFAAVFAWKVTAFMTMTIGGWSLGNAWLAYLAARRWLWNLTYTTLIYLWSFGISEMIVLVIFRGKLVMEHPIAWLYLTALSVNVIVAAVGILDFIRLRPSSEPGGILMTNVQKIPAMAFVLFVCGLGAYGLTAHIGDIGTNGGIFPEVMSLFTLRSFGAFYFSLGGAVIPYFWNKNGSAALHHAAASFALILFITLAAFVYFPLFDFSQRPGGMLYFGAYLIVGIPLIFLLRKYGTGVDHL